MSGSELLDRLAGEIAAQPSPLPRRMRVDRWIASSAMQKAIRRGETEIALRAGYAYWSVDAGSFWRRLPIVAAEDIGVGDWELVGHVQSTASNPAWRETHGDWRTASFLIGRMSDASKERSAAALVQATLSHPGWAEPCVRLSGCRDDELQELIANPNAPLADRTLAIVYLGGTTRFGPTRLARRGGNPGVLAEALTSAGIPGDLIALCPEKPSSASALFLMLPLLWSELERSQRRSVRSESLDPPQLLGDVPTWALDKHTARGKQAIARFYRSAPAIAEFGGRHIRPQSQPAALEIAVFYAEGVRFRQQLIWDRTAEFASLELEADCAAIEVNPSTMLELVELVRQHIATLDGIRAGICERRSPTGASS